MSESQTIRIKTISQFHSLRGLPAPKHPLISVINFSDMAKSPKIGQENLIFDFYSISVKRDMAHSYRYGQKDYDFDEGIMFCMAPHQVLSVIREENGNSATGWMLMIHPDFLYGTQMATAIKNYEFFDYSVNEALFLSEDEEDRIKHIMLSIIDEYQTGTDKFSQNIMVSQLETLLNYTQRFYQRQFITRGKASHQFLQQLDQLLETYFSSSDFRSDGLPSVKFLSGELNMSPQYMRSLLKSLTGLNTQQHIHEKLIEKAKERLSTTELSVSEIAYELGFEHSQSFSKLFKSKTNISPLEFRKSFN
ncbi:helix-turn-helix transcriptional regulator [Pedobacter aquatilis]|uniref:helix-turn-helix domain-containing protein n=1 Tax=Pedobacter aquatilis TaxID=351343 RepID=UPI00292E6B48|nr:helix-turn-helix transcriptional regulator [Pedobacter aquatilis]